MSIVQTAVGYSYLIAAVGFVLGLHFMNSPATARRGNLLSAAGMVLAVAATLALVIDEGTITATGWIVLGVGGLIGTLIGLRTAIRIKMTAVPQLVSLFNAVGGGAAALLAIAGFVRLTSGMHGAMTSRTIVATSLDVVIGMVTFSGSLIAAGKLQGWISGNPIVIPGARGLNVALAAVAVGGSGYLIAGSDSGIVLGIVVLCALVFGVTMVLPIGGADMPVVISLLKEVRLIPR